MGEGNGLTQMEGLRVATGFQRLVTLKLRPEEECKKSQHAVKRAGTFQKHEITDAQAQSHERPDHLLTTKT